MKLKRSITALLLASSLMAAQAQTPSATPTTAKKRTTRTHRKPAGPTTAEQIRQLREEMNTQIQGLQTQLQQRDAQLQAAQQAAQQAQAAADQASQQAAAANQAASANNANVTELQGSVSDLKTNSATLVQTIQDDQVSIKKAIETPDVLHYKGVTLTPGGFLAAETVFRNRATAADLPTAFNAIPLENTAQSKLTEFFGSGRQSRISLLAEGKLADKTLRGYYEADFLGTGVTSNNNQSNSYVLRQRQVWAEAALANGFGFIGGQMWTLATESKKGVSSIGADIATPQTIDVNYVPGFVYVRQYGFRIYKNFNNHFWLTTSFENPQTLNIGGIGGRTNYLVGSPGTGGGLYNSCATTGNGSTVSGACANYSFNLAPDIIVKATAEPGFGHYEVFGLARFFRNRVYPNGTATVPTAAGAYNEVRVGGGIGGSARVPVFHKKVDLGLKGLWGDGVGRYGASTLADSTVKPDGQLALLHGFSALSTIEVHATPRLDVYLNYGGDYDFRNSSVTSAGAPYGYGSPLLPFPATCGVEPPPTAGFAPGALPGACGQSTKDVQEEVIGYWYDFYKGPKGRLRQGLQYGYVRRDIWSGIGTTPKGNDALFYTSFRYYLP